MQHATCIQHVGEASEFKRLFIATFESFRFPIFNF